MIIYVINRLIYKFLSLFFVNKMSFLKICIDRKLHPKKNKDL